ncbi:MAG: ribonuclease PH [Alphaproteobacteria bacterium]|jgi:ribonuclease PH|nr:ribonuclease PH [Candidatus Jidaibacter sp.]
MDINFRRSLRALDQLRDINVELDYISYAEGSCLIKFGNTHVLCCASVDNYVPSFLKNTGKGWVTAEYSMLPRSTHTRITRESTKGKQDGRTHEIQRLIGRSLRSVVDLKALGERQIIVDCDVIKADGGTRTAAITGGYIALSLAINHLLSKNIIKKQPLIGQVAAISCGVISGKPMLDLEYLEDSDAEVDANFIMSSTGDLIEVQATGEKRPFTENEFTQLFTLAKKGIGELIQIQNAVLNK